MWALAGTHIYVSLHNIGSYTTVSMIWYMYTSEYIDVYKKNQSVSTHKGTNICEFAQLGLIHKRIYNMIHVYLWILVNTCEYLWILVNTCEYLWIRVNTCEYLWKHVNTCEHLWTLVNTCEYMYAYKEVLSVSVYEGRSTCRITNFAWK